MPEMDRPKPELDVASEPVEEPGPAFLTAPPRPPSLLRRFWWPVVVAVFVCVIVGGPLLAGLEWVIAGLYAVILLMGFGLLVVWACLPPRH